MFRSILRVVILVAATASAINKRRTDRRRNEAEEEFETLETELKNMEDRMDDNAKHTQHLQAHLHTTCSKLSGLRREKEAVESEFSVVKENEHSAQLHLDRLVLAKLDLLRQLSAARESLLQIDRARETLRRECTQKEQTLAELHSRISAIEDEITLVTDRFRL